MAVEREESELDAPLTPRGRKLPAKSEREPGATPLTLKSLPIARVLFAASMVIVLIFAGRVLLVRDPEGGRPSAEAVVASARDANPIVAETLPPGGSIISIGPENPVSGPLVTRVDDEILPVTGAEPPGLDPLPELVEATPHGPIPRIGASGLTPFQAYANGSQAAAGSGPPIAIVLTGMGLNEQATLDAIARLPAPVTLAFAPYGDSLAASVGQARSDGHEVMLQLPLEPFDYPDNDPGPETLLTGQPVRANLDKLVWLMARMGGYFGVMNYMGARFTASGADFSPMMEELGARGLGYLDDGTSNRSIAAQLAAGNQVPFARADMMLDANPSRAAIIAALDRLVGRAGEAGSAIGIASALPVSIETIAEWAGTASARGINLVPASALMKK